MVDGAVVVLTSYIIILWLAFRSGALGKDSIRLLTNEYSIQTNPLFVRVYYFGKSPSSHTFFRPVKVIVEKEQ
jgi:hypothetical protein